MHHGDGVERMFWDDPRVLTISLHESGRMLFPGTGFPGDIGGPDAEGTAVNVALPAGHRRRRRGCARSTPWCRRCCAAFAPDVLVTQHGCDSHFLDPLAHLALSVDAQRASYEALHDLAHEVCGGRWVALGGGGYELVDVVPRAWTHLIAIAAHRADPARHRGAGGVARATCSERFGRPGPTHMGDGVAEGGRVWWRSWEVGYDPEDAVDRAVMATRQAVFPLHGLDLWFD